MNSLIQPHQTILFQGDSITDGGRNYQPADELGFGYAGLAAAWFSARRPDEHVTFYNRGISGSRVRDLRQRWREDCIQLQPDWVSILIGINDCWRRYDSDDPTSPEDFERDYRAILQQTRSETQAQIILCEPFLLPVPPDRLGWREDLDPKIAIRRQLAADFSTLYIPFDGLFAAAAARRDAAYWAGDGVHPTLTGHALMAQSWLAAVGITW